jgi:phenylacetate-coenzyme A ligase PaaK-like adenylate-forming protein
VLATSLANRVQPIIRYDLGDSITVQPAPCPCGSRLPAIKVAGRRAETLQLASADGTMVPLLPMALHAAMNTSPGVEEYQVVQTAPATVRIHLEVAAGHDRDLAWEQFNARLWRFLKRQGLSSVTIERSAEPPHRNPRSGKFQRVLVESR